MSNRAVQANIQNLRSQVWLGGLRMPGLDQVAATVNANEAFMNQYGSSDGRVANRAINGNLTLRAWTQASKQAVQRAISGFDPQAQDDGLVIDPNYKQVLPAFINVLNEEQTEYGHSIYFPRGWNPLSVNPVEGGPQDEVVGSFAGQTGGPQREYQKAWLGCEKLALTAAADGRGYTGSATSVLYNTATAPVGGNQKAVDAFMLVDPGTEYADTTPVMIYPIDAGATVLNATTSAVTVTKSQMGSMPEPFQDVYATSAGLYILLVLMFTTAEADSDYAQLATGVTNAWSVIA